MKDKNILKSVLITIGVLVFIVSAFVIHFILTKRIMPDCEARYDQETSWQIRIQNELAQEVSDVIGHPMYSDIEGRSTPTYIYSERIPGKCELKGDGTCLGKACGEYRMSGVFAYSVPRGGYILALQKLRSYFAEIGEDLTIKNSQGNELGSFIINRIEHSSGMSESLVILIEHQDDVMLVRVSTKKRYE